VVDRGVSRGAGPTVKIGWAKVCQSVMTAQNHLRGTRHKGRIPRTAHHTYQKAGLKPYPPGG